ncbi:porin family protein [Pseudoduganella violacea]|uniref:OOP family OmpA-OmpF porin n=1 Tax=Pseudoduganella violacea TaxID=1715466 RepID=A0A7W5B9I1_9BURK|nr:porin family protein [Pseudoduganella violacea]MBB3118893.1 OOP family OmpA-OmpF porin [Pseudoduganella violacea]
MKTKFIAALIGAAVAFPFAAQAEGIYAGANIGRAEQKLNANGASLKDHDTGYKLYAGYEFNNTFGIEGGFTDLRKAEASVAKVMSANTKTRNFYVAGTATLPLNEQFNVFAKAGFARNHVKATVSSIYGSGSDTANRTSPLLGIGASYKFNKNVSLVAEFEHFGKVAKGDDGLNLKANLLSFGVRYKF